MSTSQAQILDYCLKNCLFGGWGTELLENACQYAELDKNYWQIEFPNGAIDVVDYFLQQTDERMFAALDRSNLRTTEKIRSALKTRFKMNESYKKQIESMLGVLALHPARATKLNYRTVDKIWHLAGDTATDWNFYTKRLLLSGVYSSTLLFWLNDKSTNNESTWVFLDKRLSEAGKFGKTIGQLKSKLKSIIPAI